MKKALAILSMLAVAAVAQANVWNINWSITAAYSPDDTTGSFSPALLEDYTVTWELVNGTTGDIIETMVQNGDTIGFDDRGNGGYLVEFGPDLTLQSEFSTYLGSTTLSSTQSVYQRIYATNGTDAYEWISSSVDITPVAEATSGPTDIDADAWIGLAGVGDSNASWTKTSTSVPEPATMSLLGLGALAMVLRRKLRK